MVFPPCTCSCFHFQSLLVRQQILKSSDITAKCVHTFMTSVFCFKQEPIIRKVIEQGMYVKYCKVEVYLIELKLCENSDTTAVVTRTFSRADTIGRSLYVIQNATVCGFV